MRRFLSLILATVAATLFVAPAQSSAAAAGGWTLIRSDYGTSAETPVIAMCRQFQTPTSVTLKLAAARPNATAVSVAVSWNTRSDFSGVGGNASTTTWVANRASFPFAMPLTYMVVVISWRSLSGTGYGFTAPARLPNILNCP